MGQTLCHNRLCHVMTHWCNKICHVFRVYLFICFLSFLWFLVMQKKKKIWLKHNGSPTPNSTLNLIKRLFFSRVHCLLLFSSFKSLSLLNVDCALTFYPLVLQDPDQVKNWVRLPYLHFPLSTESKSVSASL